MNALTTLTTQLATKLNMGDGAGLIETLKATAFKGNVSDDQMTALMVVANQYGLNPWTKEIYAFPDKSNGIVPVVGVDGWSRIINEHPMFDGMEFEQDAESCTCIIYRKDRNRPIKVTEYMSECKRANVGPWISHPKRMLRHKALIQGARLAFGYTGIYDQDEAERILEKDITAPRTRNAQIAEAARPVANSTNDSSRLELIEKLESVASNQGIDAYSTLWQGLSKQERQMVGASEHARLKEIGQNYGVIDGDYEEVSA
jgi:phage recombination protein Bet